MALDGHSNIFSLVNNQTKIRLWDREDEEEEIRRGGGWGEMGYHRFGKDRVGRG